MTDTRYHPPSSDGDDIQMEPLPGSWLPEPRPGGGDAYWDRYANRLMAELEPVLAARGGRSRGISWVAEIGDRLGTASLLAAAALVALLAVEIHERVTAPLVPGTDDLALAIVAAEGDPLLLWERLGIPADPLLARLTFDGAPR